MVETKFLNLPLRFSIELLKKLQYSLLQLVQFSVLTEKMKQNRLATYSVISVAYNMNTHSVFKFIKSVSKPGSKKKCKVKSKQNAM